MTQGLRARKRAALERELARTAYQLVEERGFADVTVDDIVDAVGVARRTFSNYFSCKEEAVAAVVLHEAGTGLAAWQPPADPQTLPSVMRDLVAHQVRVGAFIALRDLARLAREHPPLVPWFREAQWRLWSFAGARVLDALEVTDPAYRAEVTAMVGAVFGVITSLLLPDQGSAVSTAAPSTEDGLPNAVQVRALVDHVLDQLDRGYRA